MHCPLSALNILKGFYLVASRLTLDMRSLCFLIKTIVLVATPSSIINFGEPTRSQILASETQHTQAIFQFGDHHLRL